MMYVFIFIGLFLFIVIGSILSAEGNIKREKEKFNKIGIDVSNFIDAGKYVYGHPKIDKPTEECFLYISEDTIDIYCREKITLERKLLAKIPKKEIIDITIEDETTISQRVSLGRLAVVGIFAFAMKKKKVDSLFYLIIKWKQGGKFENETFFEFNGNAATQRANTLRNKLVNCFDN